MNNKLKPYLITSIDASGKILPSLPSQHKTFKEEWLQELLYKHPSILPLHQIDEDFTPPISIGREIANIDNLFISPKGLITIVETKLWRNPEAHRTVVAQILDYANTLASWSFQQLNEAVQAFMKKWHGESKSIYQLVKRKIRDDDSNEIEFQQRVQNCLDNGRFALIIVGDKIFPGATQLAEVIQSAPHMQYTMGFVELCCYKMEKGSDWPLIVIPNFVTKTNEITRAVVKVVYEEKKPDVEVVTPIEEKTASGHTTFAEFVASLPSAISDVFKSYIEGWKKTGYTVYWGQVGFSLRINWKGKLTTILDAYPTYIGILGEKRVKKYELPMSNYMKYKEQLMKSPVLSSALASGIKHVKYIYYEDISVDDIALLLNATDALAQAFCGAAKSEF